MLVNVIKKGSQPPSDRDCYIGRGSVLGNPASHSDKPNLAKVRCETREESIEYFKDYLIDKIAEGGNPICDELNSLYRLAQQKDGINLVCFCKPLACHGDFIKAILELIYKSPKRLYAGIGSRETPDDKLSQMTLIGKRLARLGFVLRSGGAVGADSAFETGSDDGNGFKEIFLADDATQEAFKIASRIHPNWAACSEYAKKLHARNVFQILGRDLKTPVDFVTCWTKMGLPSGGTRTAIMLARENKIPVINLATENFWL